MFRDGVLIYPDGGIEVFRTLPSGGALCFGVVGTEVPEADLRAATEIWAEPHDEYGLPALDPGNAPIYRVTEAYEPMTRESAAEYLAKIAQDRDDADAELATEAAEAFAEERGQ